MEPEVVAFLKRIAFTIFLIIAWLLINSTFGIMFNLAFPVERIRIGNIIFYIWFAGSFIFLLRYLLRLWRRPLI
ncbi:MAG: hypothetical protein ACTHJ5_08780 [Ilyomonas sp.]